MATKSSYEFAFIQGGVVPNHQRDSERKGNPDDITLVKTKR